MNVPDNGETDLSELADPVSTPPSPNTHTHVPPRALIQTIWVHTAKSVSLSVSSCSGSALELWGASSFTSRTFARSRRCLCGRSSEPIGASESSEELLHSPLTRLTPCSRRMAKDKLKRRGDGDVMFPGVITLYEKGWEPRVDHDPVQGSQHSVCGLAPLHCDRQPELATASSTDSTGWER